MQKLPTTTTTVTGVRVQVEIPHQEIPSQKDTSSSTPTSTMPPDSEFMELVSARNNYLDRADRYSMINKGQQPLSSEDLNHKKGDDKLKAKVENIIEESEVTIQNMEQPPTLMPIPLSPIPGSVDTTPIKDTFDTNISEKIRGVSREKLQHTGDEKSGDYESHNGTPNPRHESIPLKLQISHPTVIASDVGDTAETDHDTDSMSPVSPMSTQQHVRTSEREKEQHEAYPVPQIQLQQLFSQLQKEQPSLDDNMFNLRDILQLPTSEERLKAFDEQREVFANLDIGLRTWIVYAMLQGHQNGSYIQQQTLQQRFTQPIEPQLNDNRVQQQYSSYSPIRAPEQEGTWRRQANGSSLPEQQQRQRLPSQQQDLDSTSPISPVGLYSPPIQHRNSQQSHPISPVGLYSPPIQHQNSQQSHQQSQVPRMQTQYQAYNKHEQQQEASSPIGAQLYDRPMSVATQLSAQDLPDSNYQQRIQSQQDRQYREQGQEPRQQEPTPVLPPQPPPQQQQVPGQLQYQAYRTDVQQQPRGYQAKKQSLQDVPPQGGTLSPAQGSQSTSMQSPVQQVSSYKQQEYSSPIQSPSASQSQEAAPSQDLHKPPNAPAMQPWPPQLARSPTMVQQQWQEEKRQIIEKNNMHSPDQPSTTQQRPGWQSHKMPPQQGQQGPMSAPHEPQILFLGQDSAQGKQQAQMEDTKPKHGFRGFLAKFSKSRLVSVPLSVYSLFEVLILL